MKNNTRLLNCILIIALSCFFQFAKAQIIYTDVLPDSTCNIDGCQYQLDLNNDGITDFTIKYDTGFQACGNPCGGHKATKKVAIKPSSLSGVVQNSADSLPSALTENNSIDASLTFYSTNNQVLVSTHPACGPICFLVGEGNWSGAIDKYVGLRISINGNYYYGWARLDVTNGYTNGFTVKDYAYNSSPNQSILAGQSLATGISSFKNQDQFLLFPNPFLTSTTISFSLSSSQNVSLKIYDVTGRFVSTLVNETMSAGAHQLQWNATDESGNSVIAGIYFLKMQPANESETVRLSVVK